jgi:predicted dinucleotide-binding enzyme
MKIGVIGSGVVAQTLAAGFLKHGHAVMMGTRDAAKLAPWLAANPRATVGGMRAAAASAQLVVLAVKGTAALEALRAVGAEQLAGKPVIDATNPIKDAPPVNGVLQFFTTHDESLMERLQREAPAAQLVKAFSSVGNPQFVNPKYQAGRPTMFICGNEPSAKATVTQILDQFGWEALDMGRVEAARAIEPLCMLWCIQGFLRNEWTHAFKVLHAS